MNRGTAKKPQDFGQLARRITRWATNLLATSVIILAALAFGRQTIAWWRADRNPGESSGARQVTTAGTMGNEAILHRMEFGDIPLSFQRIAVAGSRQDAYAMLRDRCREVAARGTTPRHPVGKWESRMLATLEDLDPVAQQPGRWRLFELDGPVLLVAAVCRTGDGKTGGLPEKGSVPAERVVSWGLGLPGESPAAQSAAGWTLLVCDATMVPTHEDTSIATPPLPPSSERTLSVAVAGGGRIVGFQCSGSAIALQEFFDKWSAETGWLQEGLWQQLGHTRHARFGDPRRGWIEVQLLSDAAQSHRGLLVMTPPDTMAEH